MFSLKLPFNAQLNHQGSPGVSSYSAESFDKLGTRWHCGRSKHYRWTQYRKCACLCNLGFQLLTAAVSLTFVLISESMPYQCAVPGCSQTGKSYGFPKDAELWCVAIRRGDEKGQLWSPKTSHHRVCKQHFKETDFRESDTGSADAAS